VGFVVPACLYDVYFHIKILRTLQLSKVSHLIKIHAVKQVEL